MIQIRDLTKRYDATLAVDGLSLTIERGQIVGLLGPNGAGKSTTIRILCGYLSPTSGTIVFDGIDVTADPLAVKARIGYLPESAPLYQDQMVHDYLTHVAELREIPLAEIPGRLATVADQCGLRGVMHKNIGELSKGYRQRVGLAHAMIGDPDVLVLDEPTSGLDPNQIVEIRELIRNVGSRKTVLLSSHILSEVEATCDRVVIIAKGKLLADGSPASIRQQFSGKRALRVEIARVETEEARSLFSRLPGVLRAEAQAGAVSTFTLTLEENAEVKQSVVKLVSEKGWDLQSLREDTKSLEDVFRDLTA